MSRIVPLAIVTALVLTAFGASSAGAAWLDYDDILGNWCGSQSNPTWGNYNISRDTLTVTRLPGRSRTELTIDRFDFSDMDVTIYYFSAGHGREAGRAGNVVSKVIFQQFSIDRQSMVQAAADDGLGEYHFKRCDQ